MSHSQLPTKTISSEITCDTSQDLLQYKEGFWSIHKAAAQNFHTKVKKYITANPHMIESRTSTKSKLTPLLVAARYGAIDTFHLLIRMGANVEAQTAEGLTAVQCAAINKHTKLVISLIRSTEINIFQEMFSFVEEYLVRNTAIDAPQINLFKVLALVMQEYVSKHPTSRMSRLYQGKIKTANGVQVMHELIKKCVDHKLLSLKVGKTATDIVFNMSKCQSLGWEILNNSVSQHLLCLLDTLESNEGCISIVKTLGTLIKSFPDSMNQMVSNGALRVVFKLIHTHQDEVLRLTVLECMQFCILNVKMRECLYREGVISHIVNLMKMPDFGRKLLIAVIKILNSIASSSEEMRTDVVLQGAVSIVVEKFYVNSQVLAENIINLLSTLCVDKGDAENALKESPHAVNTLIYIASHSMNPSVRYKSFKILWSTAGENSCERRALAGLIGPSSLITFISLASEDLKFIATVAVKLLSPPLFGMQEEIAANGGVIPLLKVIRLASSDIQLEALLALEYLSCQVAQRPNKTIQQSFLEGDGVQLLLRLIASSQSLTIKLQAMCTLAAMSTGDQKMKAMIVRDSRFKLYELINYLDTMSVEQDKPHLLLVIKAISYLAYKSLETQYVIAYTKKLPIEPFQHLFHSNDTYISTETAFHTIVLQRIFRTRENQTNILAESIQHIGRELNSAIRTKDVKLQAHICSLLCSLLHVRAGILNAFLTVDIVSLLVILLLSQFEHSRRTAAIALSYITSNPRGSRIILGYCRKTPKIFQRLKSYTDGYPLNVDFLEAWEHYRGTYLTGKARKRGTTPKGVSSVFAGARIFCK